MHGLLKTMVVSVILMGTCGGLPPPALAYGTPSSLRSFCFESSDVQKDFLKRLKRDNIEFDLKDNGCAQFPEETNDQVVRRIIYKVLAKYYSENSIYYPQKRYAKMLERLLAQHDIPYGTFIDSGKRFINWPAAYSKIATRCIMRVEAQHKQDILHALERGDNPSNP